MLRNVVLTIISVIVILSGAISFWAGIFDKVVISQKEIGPYNIVYRGHQGPYSAVPFIINDVFKYVKNNNNNAVLKGFAIFYDDPGKVSTSNLRSICGVITDSILQTSPPYNSALVKRGNYIIGVFPLRSFFSYATGTFKFYPALDAYTKNHHICISGPVMEVYDLKNKVILYITSQQSNVDFPQFKK